LVTRSKVLKREAVALQDQKVKIPAGMCGGQAGDGACRPEVDLNFTKPLEPHVDIVRGPDGTIEAITVRCTCGRETTLHCEYQEEGARK